MTKIFVPHPYQEATIKFCIENPNVAIFQDPGLGKTAQVLSVIKHFKKRTLVVAPPDVIHRAWPREIRKWDFSEKIRFTILHGPNKEARFLRNFGIYLINVEGIKWLFTKAVPKHKRWPWDILVVDESLIFKNHQSKRFDIMSQVLSNFDRRYILTGTPIPKGYLDLWGQMYILDKGMRLKQSWYSYRNTYFYQADYKGFDWQLLPGQEEEIEKRIADITVRIAGRDHLDLPDIVYNDIPIQLNVKARKHYNEMLRQLKTEFDSGLITTAANAAVKSNKLQTIANGFSYITKKDLVTNKVTRIGEELIHEAKVDVIESLINELNGNPLLVGFHYQYDLKMLLKRFPKTPYFGSGISQRDKYFLEKRWNDGKIPLLFAQIHSTALGLNLQEAGYNVAFFSLVWNWMDTDQFIKRVARQGQESDRVIVHRLIAENTVDELIVERLENREMTQNQFLDAMKQHTNNIIFTGD